MYKSGANFADRNNIIKMHEGGEHTLEQIRALTKVNMTTIQRVIADVTPVEVAPKIKEEFPDIEI